MVEYTKTTYFGSLSELKRPILVRPVRAIETLTAKQNQSERSSQLLI